MGDVDGSFPLGRALADHSDLAAPPKMQWEINSGKQRQIADSKDQYKLYSGQQTTARMEGRKWRMDAMRMARSETRGGQER